MGKFYEGLAGELILYTRYIAWLNAVPKHDRPRRVSEQQADEPVSRIKAFVERGVDLEMPPLSAPWLIDMLMEIGPVEAGGMGAVPLSWREIASWQASTGHPLRPWEVRLIRRLSGEFLAESQRAEKSDCPAPWVAAPSTDQRAVVANKLRSFFGGLGRRS